MSQQHTGTAAAACAERKQGRDDPNKQRLWYPRIVWFDALGSQAMLSWRAASGLRSCAQLSNYSPTCNSNSSWSLSCPLAGLKTSPQYSWLLRDLASVDRTVTPCASHGAPRHLRPYDCSPVAML